MSLAEWIVIGALFWCVAAIITAIMFSLLMTGQKLMEAEHKARQERRLTDRE